MKPSLAALLLVLSAGSLRLFAGDGFIDKEGLVRIPPSFDEVSCFREGRARARTGAQWGYIDPKGKVVIAAKFQSASSFHDGLARITVL